MVIQHHAGTARPDQSIASGIGLPALLFIRPQRVLENCAPDNGNSISGNLGRQSRMSHQLARAVHSGEFWPAGFVLLLQNPPA